jgi:predicted transcriptional regulator
VVTLTVEDDDGARAVGTLNLSIDEAPMLYEDPVVLTVSIGLLIVLVLAVVASTEPGKYSILLLFAPLIIKTEDVLDNKTRHAILGIIVSNPGIHYSAIRDEIELPNGQAVYHLHVLERKEFIRSVRDGKLKRFYQAFVKVPEDVGRSPEETRDAIVEVVQMMPGINQQEVMEELGMDRNEASYYLRNLDKEGRLTAKKDRLSRDTSSCPVRHNLSCPVHDN